MESRRKGRTGLGSKVRSELVDKSAESVRMTLSKSEKAAELMRKTDENKRRKKKKSKPIREEEENAGPAGATAFSGSFADFLTHLQEGKEERDQRELNEKLKKAAALKAKKQAELDSALSFIDGQLKSSSDLSDDEEDQLIPNIKSEERESWANQLTWGEIRGQGQSPQMSEFPQAPSTVSSMRGEESLAEENIPGEKVHHSRVKVEEDSEDRDRVTQDMCSTSVSTESNLQMMKCERVPDSRKEKFYLFVQSGKRKFQLSLEGHKKVKRVRVAVASQLQVGTHRVVLQVVLKYSE